DQCIDNIRIRAGDPHANAAQRAFGHAITFDALPGCAVVIRTVEAVFFSAAIERPRRAIAFPHRGEKYMGIAGVEDDVNAAGAVVEIQDFLPGLAAIASAEDSALRV